MVSTSFHYFGHRDFGNFVVAFLKWRLRIDPDPCSPGVKRPCAKLPPNWEGEAEAAGRADRDTGHGVVLVTGAAAAALPDSGRFQSEQHPSPAAAAAAA